MAAGAWLPAADAAGGGMDSRLIDVAIGLVLVWLISSCVVSGLVEGVARLTRLRAKELEAELRRWLDQTEPTAEPGSLALLRRQGVGARPAEGDKFAAFLAELGPAIRSTAAKFEDTYVDARTFARKAVKLGEGLAGTKLKEVLDDIQAAGITQAKEKVEEVERWFDGRMRTVSEAFKRRARVLAVGAGLLVAVGLGIDSIDLARRLHADDALRGDFVELATTVEDPGDPETCAIPDPSDEDEAPPSDGDDAGAAGGDRDSGGAEGSSDEPQTVEELKRNMACVDRLLQSLTDLKLVPDARNPFTPDFWEQRWDRAPGILATAAAIGFGAPFWFANLKRLLSVRPSKQG